MDPLEYHHIEKIIAFHQNRTLSSASLAEAAQLIGMSPSQLQQRFIAWSGITPMQFFQYLDSNNPSKRLDSSSIIQNSSERDINIEVISTEKFKMQKKNLTLHYGFHATPFGNCLLALMENKICALAFVDHTKQTDALDELSKVWENTPLKKGDKSGEEIIQQVFYQTKSPRKAKLTVFLKGTHLQIKVWKTLLCIPEGTTIAYATLAKAINHPQAYRAIGTAVGQNPIGYLIPCHRVLRADGRLGGYHWGTMRKRVILALEAAVINQR
jgi:AraC family transcriptional regulator of adaptative response/methylated-DNA-[protein]-cysteine methyltransferase